MLGRYPAQEEKIMKNLKELELNIKIGTKHMPIFDIKDELLGENAMHCKTKEDAEIFCNFLHRQGETWLNGDTFLDCGWEDHKENTGYNYGFRQRADIRYWEDLGCTILEFEDFDPKSWEM